jgi:hypothetical protein
MLAILLLGLFLSATSSHAAPKAVVEAVKAALNDPDSAKIRNVRKTGPNSYCGWVNAKNAYGGYSGEQLFYDDSGFVQIFDLATAFDQSDLAAQTAAFAAGHASEMKPRLSEAGKKVEPCLRGFKGN